ncbi:hypothetical protein [Exiguobacterium sp. s133]|uniref:hypothetical protein n=1 Tax=Exiguobacterium sp. s133 TaxID=2751213 RepID=UPI001BEA8219|nr:hypothetical protein [Exiguobacterium sp. s133]
MSKVTLYTCKNGYQLFKAGKDFAASTEMQSEFDYVVKAPRENLLKIDLEDGIDCYDVINLNSVTVTSRGLVESN